MKDYRLLAAEAVAPHAGMDPAALADLFQTPPDPTMGDLGMPCFPLAKTMKRNPAQIAQELADAVGVPAGFRAVKAAGPYLNFTIDAAELIGGTLRAVREADAPFGSGREGEGRTVVVDFSSPNIAKPLAIHHIRSTILGAALARLYAFRGYTVERVNHLGDWGTNFGQLMVAYKRQEAEHPDRTPDIHGLLEMYIRFHREAGDEATLQDEAKAWFVKLEEGDPEAVRLWELFCAESLKSFRQLYARLHVDFDHYIGESFFNDRMEATVERIRAAGLAEESEGALV
ncbi:MAG: arginine--tRNA ligase, partial [Planctomycetota bacterium]